MTDYTNKEPLRLWFPELNSLQIDRLRSALKAEYERGQTEILEELWGDFHSSPKEYDDHLMEMNRWSNTVAHKLKQLKSNKED